MGQTEGDEALEEGQKTLDAFEDKIEKLNDHLELLIGSLMVCSTNFSGIFKAERLSASVSNSCTSQ